jgi:hypothetical protein
VVLRDGDLFFEVFSHLWQAYRKTPARARWLFFALSAVEAQL